MYLLDEELIEKIRNGDTLTFEQLFLELQPRLFAFGRKFFDDGDIIKDIIQDIFFDFWNRKNNLTIRGSVKSYLFRMFYNRCLNYLRDQKIHERYEAHALLQLKKEELEYYDPEYNTHTSIFMKEIEEILQQSLDQLPEGCRQIFLLSRLEGLDHKEIAEKLGLSVRTVENQIYRALKIIKENLRDYLPIISAIIWRIVQR